MESIKRKIVLIGDVVVSEACKSLLADYGFNQMGKEFVNYRTTINECYQLSLILHEQYDLHLTDSVKWVNGDMITYYELSQGYKCDLCGALDMKPNLPCVKHT